MGAVSRGQKGAGRTPRSLRPEISPARFIGHINNPRSASSPAEPLTTKEPALPGAGTKPRRSNYSLVVGAWCCLSLRGSKPARSRDWPVQATGLSLHQRHGAPRNVALSTLRHSPRTRVVPRVPRPRNSRVATPEYRQPDAARRTSATWNPRRIRLVVPPSGSTVLALRHRLESVSSFGMVHRALGCAARPAPFLRLSL